VSEAVPEKLTDSKLSVEQIQAIFDASPFISFLGLRVVSLDYATGSLSVTMPMRAELERRAGTRQFHGGPIAAFIDIVGDFAVGMALGGGVPIQVGNDTIGGVGSSGSSQTQDDACAKAGVAKVADHLK